MSKFKPYSLSEPEPSEASIIIGSRHTEKMIIKAMYVFNNFKKMNQGIYIALLVFGSVEKNKKHPTDIDLYCFLNNEHFKNQYDESYWMDELEWEYQQTENTINHYINQDLLDRTRLFKESLEEKEVNCNVFPRSISFDMIKELINQMYQSNGKYVYNEETLASMLHFSLNFDINAYRLHMFDTLIKLGENGQKIWERIKKSYEAWANSDFINYGIKKQYPRDLIEAATFFGFNVQ